MTRTIDTYLYQGTYFMIDATRPMFDAQKSVFPTKTVGTIVTIDARNTDMKSLYVMNSANNTWTDKSAVSAHYNAVTTYEYFRTTFNRNSIDNKGMAIQSVVHVTSNNQPMNNAFWNGQFMAYGDGKTWKPLAGGLDIGAHEMTHGVTGFTAGLEYVFQSGALNESISDIFGAMVDRDDWQMGEGIVPVSSFPSGALRDMADPHNGVTDKNHPAWQPSHMNEFMKLDINYDNGGVHINSGIPNHCAYLLAQAIGRDKTERIVYCA
ncbi:MAG: M4 family metallopeptidase, partial [Chlorobi bacterium]|nr:M4 family metallopeptidase [Chlorobiota bacterium]